MVRNEASMNVGIHSLYEEDDSVMNPKLGTEVCFSAANADFWGWTRQASWDTNPSLARPSLRLLLKETKSNKHKREAFYPNCEL